MTRQWARELRSMPERELRGVMARDTSFHVVEVSLMNAPDGPEKDELKRIPTALRFSQSDLAALRRFTRQTLNADRQWQRLLRDVSPPATKRFTTTGDNHD